MLISYSWLRDLIYTDLSPDELGLALTAAGLAVESVHAVKDDFVLDVDLTSNRPDCLSHLGIAREVGVITSKPVETRVSTIDSIPVPAALAGETVRIDAPDLCNRFTARIIKGVKIGPSPEWLVNRLEAIGERSINNVADITNYVMHELGQPMHSFDLDKLTGGRIIVRCARPGENIVTLDGVERELEPSMLAICDAEKPAAVAGIMGGLDSSITDSTVNVLLEVAYFDPPGIRLTSRQLNLTTEASYRFERGVDIENLIKASNRATEMICEFAGGEAYEFFDVYPQSPQGKKIESANLSAAVKRLTGLEVSQERCVEILEALGIESFPHEGDAESLVFTSPSWRHDIAIEEDLVEEVARHIGYVNIAEQLPPAFGAGEYQPTEVREKTLRQTLVGLGFDEAISYSFIDTKYDGIIDPVPQVLDETADQEYVTLQDSVIEGAVRMRPTELPALLEGLRHNLNRQRRDIRLFELGKVFAGKTGEFPLPNEQEVLAIAITGGESLEGRASVSRQFDFYDLKGAVEAALDAIGFPQADFSTAEVKHLRKGQSASVSLSGETLGYLGRLADEIAAGFKFKQPVYVAEINVQAILERVPAPVLYRPLSKYPGIVRDVSFICSRGLSFTAIKNQILLQNPDLLKSVSFVDSYEGKGIAPDERSITIRLEFQSEERTLMDSEVDEVHDRILSDLKAVLPVSVRA